MAGQMLEKMKQISFQEILIYEKILHERRKGRHAYYTFVKWSNKPDTNCPENRGKNIS